MHATEWNPPRSILWIAAVAAVALTALLCFDALAAEAAEATGPAEVQAWLSEVEKARKEKDGAGPGAVLERAPALHNALEDAALRAKIQAALGAVLKDKKAGNARGDAAKALGALNDPAGAWKHLKPALPAAKSPEAEPFRMRALEAVGTLAPDAAIGDLLKIVKKGKAREVVKGAMAALGAYGASPKREAVLKDLLDKITKLHASAASASRKDAKKKKKKSKDGEAPKTSEAVYAWTAYEPVLVGSLNKLTGQSCTSGDEWLTLYKENKKKLSALFRGST